MPDVPLFTTSTLVSCSIEVVRFPRAAHSWGLAVAPVDDTVVDEPDAAAPLDALDAAVVDEALADEAVVDDLDALDDVDEVDEAPDVVPADGDELSLPHAPA